MARLLEQIKAKNKIVGKRQIIRVGGALIDHIEHASLRPLFFKYHLT